MKALIIGGTRGIGKATAELLRVQGWEVYAWGKSIFNVHRMPPLLLGEVDALVFCAGDIEDTYHQAFDFPIAFYTLSNRRDFVKKGGVIVAVSSVAADKPAKVNAHYAAAKSALESYARTVADSDLARAHGWRVEVVRFDLVDTDMLKLLPPETLVGRTIISAEEAAGVIVDKVIDVSAR